MKKILNIGVLAHVDAGKTSLTERLLFNNGVIQTLGSVDKGNTQTDSMALERQRGITIKSAATSFTLDDLKINILDTPGHPDFIAEVERVLGVLDGAILVISAVEGVQAQTRVLMRALKRLKVPTIIFVNKIDRTGARYESLINDIRTKLDPNVTVMGTVTNLGTKDTKFTLNEGVNTSGCPIFFGSAITNTGIDALTSGIKSLPKPKNKATGPLSGSIFKVERAPSGEKLAYVRLFSGSLQVRDQLEVGKVKAITVFENGATKPAKSVNAGDIAKISGLTDIKVGDKLGETTGSSTFHFSPPTLETVVKPAREGDRGALRAALDQLAEQDPLINLRQDDVRRELSLSLYGEVQKEVVEDTLLREYGIEVQFQETTTICVERVKGVGSAVEFKPTSRVGAPEFDKKINQFLATIGLRVEPGPVDSGIQFKISGEASGNMPAAFYKAVEETVVDTLSQGLYGWQVVDCIITMTHAAYWPRQSSAHGVFDKNISSTARDFRCLTPLVLMDALLDAGVVVCEPLHKFKLEVPVESLDAVLNLLSQLNAIPTRTEQLTQSYSLEGEIAVKNIHNLQKQLPRLTSGEGVLESEFKEYRPVHGHAPSRRRTDNNPLNRREYLLKTLKSKQLPRHRKRSYGNQ